MANADAGWIGLTDPDGPAGWLARLGPGRLRVVPDGAAFRGALVETSPRIAVLAAPPATAADEAAALDARARRDGLRIIHLTDPGDVERRIDALRRGFDDALPTTIDPHEFVRRLEILDRRRPRARRGREIPVASGVVLDPVAHDVRRDGEAIHLRPKEFQLLALLAAHPGRAFTRRQLLDRVWGPDHVGDPRTVDVHVRWLRAKVEPSPARPAHLLTVRGIGYRLDPPGR